MQNLAVAAASTNLALRASVLAIVLSPALHCLTSNNSVVWFYGRKTRSSHGLYGVCAQFTSLTLAFVSDLYAIYVCASLNDTM
jgi:hypothetical protein